MAEITHSPSVERPYETRRVSTVNSEYVVGGGVEPPSLRFWGESQASVSVARSVTGQPSACGPKKSDPLCSQRIRLWLKRGLYAAILRVW